MKRAVVVIGGGCNGLTAASVLAKAGCKVTLFEARDALGGLAAPRSFGDGFSAPILHDTSQVRAAVVDTLGLEGHGLRLCKTPPTIAAPSRSGTVWLRGDKIEGPLAEGDTKRYAEWHGFIARVAPVLRDLMNAPPPDPTGHVLSLLWQGWKVRRLGAADMTELIRVAPMCVADWMRDSFRTERLGAAKCLPAVEGAFTGPWSAGTAFNLLLREALAGPEVEGGAPALAAALEKAARALSVDLRTSSPVEAIRLQAGAIAGVTVGGETIACDTLLATCDPKTTFLKLIGPERLPLALAEDIEHLRARGSTAKVHLAVAGKLEIDGTAIDGLRTGDSLDAIERAFDPVKYRTFSKTPVLDARAWPAEGGEHTIVSMLVHGAAYALEGGWTNEARDALGRAAIDSFLAACPGVEVVASETLTPADLEREYHLSGGHLHHGEHALDQLLFMRPTVECARYATPIKNLYLGGSGSHPGGGLTLAPGALAAKAVLDRS